MGQESDHDKSGPSAAWISNGHSAAAQRSCNAAVLYERVMKLVALPMVNSTRTCISLSPTMHK
jgi:hypothetical protein